MTKKSVKNEKNEQPTVISVEDNHKRFLKKRILEFNNHLAAFNLAVSKVMESGTVLRDFADMAADGDGDLFPISADDIVDKETAIKAGVPAFIFMK